MDYAQLIKIFGAFFAIMNPFVNLPIFLALTDGYSTADQKSLALKIGLFSTIMSGVVLVAGAGIIGFFGITIDQFRIAGGLVLASIAWSMLNGGGIASHHGNDGERDHLESLSSLAFYPITFPMIVGPGTIATLIIYGGHTSSVNGLIAVAAILALVLALLVGVLYFASAIGRLMSDVMRVITTRIMGMILLAIAIEMTTDGLAAVFPALTSAG